VRAFCHPTGTNKVTHVSCSNTHTHAHCHTHTQLLWSCCVCRGDGRGPDHMCSEVGWIWTPMGGGPPLGTPGFPADGTQQNRPDNASLDRFPQGQREREGERERYIPGDWPTGDILPHDWRERGDLSVPRRLTPAQQNGGE